MARLELEVSKRETTGKKVRFLRREGIIPASLYGHDVNSTALQIEAKRLKHILAQAGKTDLIDLRFTDSKTTKKVLVREVQQNPLTDELLHVDFYHVKMTERISAEVPLVFTGDAPALKNRNVSLLRLIDSLTVEALPDALPHSLEVDLSTLDHTDQAVYVKDIHIGDGVTLLDDPEQMVVKVTETRGAAEIEEAEAEAEEEAEKLEAEAEASPEE